MTPVAAAHPRKLFVYDPDHLFPGVVVNPIENEPAVCANSRVVNGSSAIPEMAGSLEADPFPFHRVRPAHHASQVGLAGQPAADLVGVTCRRAAYEAVQQYALFAEPEELIAREVDAFNHEILPDRWWMSLRARWAISPYFVEGTFGRRCPAGEALRAGLEGCGSISLHAPNARSLLVTITNAPATCTMTGSVGPVLPREAGHLAAGALTPPRYPFTVASIAYLLATDSVRCESTLAHHVELYVAPTATPPNDPTTAISTTSIDVAASAAATAMTTGDRGVTLTLDPAITLGDGQVLVVAIALAVNGDGSKSLCVASCTDEVSMVGQNWWSNAAAPPFAWTDLKHFGFDSELRISATAAE